MNRVDTTVPTITCPAAQTLVLNATCAGVLADYTSLATVADNCTATGALRDTITSCRYCSIWCWNNSGDFDCN
ncbi:MAG: hypothetical protein IPP69_00875 [Flavobacteriales bacterium]|nr:hypothetical protein [Flavobacteriales bacterium]